ncbi:MAG TPA: hypothetical protein DEA22_04095 [Blastocatellia bacterium]|nr:hypothetical protein [Blastocatellia bacterium]
MISAMKRFSSEIGPNARKKFDHRQGFSNTRLLICSRSQRIFPLPQIAKAAHLSKNQPENES